MIAGQQVRDTIPHGLDDGRPLVPEHDGHHVGMDAVHRVGVGAAHARRRHPDLHLAGLGRVELEVLEPQVVDVPEHRGAHASKYDLAQRVPMRHARGVTKPKVTVRGEATIRARPDQAHLSLEIVKVDRHPDDAHADVARRSQAMDALFEDLGIPKERRTTTGVSVRPEQEWSGNRWVRKGWRASNRVLVRLEDPSALGRLVGEAVDRVEATVEGPWWTVTQDHPARAEAYIGAARHARTKAQAYAGALGCALGAITEIREPGTGHGGVPIERIDHSRATFSVSASRAVEEAPQIDVDPGEVEIAGAVEVTFALET